MPFRANPTGCRPARHDALTLCLLGVFAAAVLAGWWRLGAPREVPEPPGDRVACVSYAPYRLPGETPFDPRMRVTRERIADDLRRLAAKTGCVRTYSVDQGLDQVPSVARELGMQVLLGAWLGRDREENAAQLARAIDVARSESPTVRALIVGNEVLLRRELPEGELAGLIEQANRALDVPVTYADVWEFWLRHPRIASAVDFLTVHVLPYWEDEPVAVEGAVEHVLAIREHVRAAFPGREILIGETGWPRAGRQRQHAVPGRVEQARFVRGFVAAAQSHSIDYNLIEAFDQPWKRRLEGAMGGYWGLFDRDGAPAFPWHGPVQADPRWREGIGVAAAGAAGFALLAWLRGRRGRAMLAVALAGASAGGLLVAQWRHAVMWNEDIAGALPALAGAAFTLAYGWLGADALAARGVNAAPGVHDVMRAAKGALRRAWRGREVDAWAAAESAAPPAPAAARPRARSPSAADAISCLRFAWLFAAAASVVLLVFDARYRGFPWASFALPVGLAVLSALRGGRLPARAREERVLCIVIIAGALLALPMETLANREAVVFLGGMLLYAGACVAGRLPGTQGMRASTSSPSSAPKADRSNE